MLFLSASVDRNIDSPDLPEVLLSVMFVLKSGIETFSVPRLRMFMSVSREFRQARAEFTYNLLDTKSNARYHVVLVDAKYVIKEASVTAVVSNPVLIAIKIK